MSSSRFYRIEKTKELYKQGFTSDEIAYEIGVSGNTVRQYLREVMPIIEKELYLESLIAECSKLMNEIQSDDSEKNSKYLRKTIRALLKIIKLNTKIYHAKSDLNHSVDDLKDSIISSCESVFSSIYSSVIVSMTQTFNDEKNSKSISVEERDLYNKSFEKWIYLSQKEKVLEENYSDFKTKVESIDNEDGIENITSILKKVEKKFGLKSLVLMTENGITDSLNSINVSFEELNVKNPYFYKVNSGMLINLFLPGFGTLFYFDGSLSSAIVQITFTIIGFIPNMFLFYIISWIWSLILGIKLKKL